MRHTCVQTRHHFQRRLISNIWFCEVHHCNKVGPGGWISLFDHRAIPEVQGRINSFSWPLLRSQKQQSHAQSIAIMLRTSAYSEHSDSLGLVISAESVVGKMHAKSTAQYNGTDAVQSMLYCLHNHQIILDNAAPAIKGFPALCWHEPHSLSLHSLSAIRTQKQVVLVEVRNPKNGSFRLHSVATPLPKSI